MQTKKILGWLCLVLLGVLASPQRCHAQCSVLPNLLPVNLNSANSTISISGLKCEPCRVGYGENRAICLCREDCKSLIPPESVIDQMYNDCVEDCGDEFPNDPNSYHHCLGYCSQLPYESYNNCLSSCGNYNELRRPIAYVYRIRLWYTSGFVPSFDGDPDETVQSEILTGAPPPTISLSLFNTPSGSYSYCYFTEVVIDYDDGTCCYFINSECISIG